MRITVPTHVRDSTAPSSALEDAPLAESCTVIDLGGRIEAVGDQADVAEQDASREGRPRTVVR